MDLAPFEVLRESERMRPEALRWREAFAEARVLIERGDPGALEQRIAARSRWHSPAIGESGKARAESVRRS